MWFPIRALRKRWNSHSMSVNTCVWWYQFSVLRYYQSIIQHMDLVWKCRYSAAMLVQLKEEEEGTNTHEIIENIIGSQVKFCKVACMSWTISQSNGFYSLDIFNWWYPWLFLFTLSAMIKCRWMFSVLCLLFVWLFSYIESLWPNDWFECIKIVVRLCWCRRFHNIRWWQHLLWLSNAHSCAQ